MIAAKHLLKLVPLVFLAGALFAADQPPYDETRGRTSTSRLGDR